MHRHHIVPRSRGGSDENWNFVELDPYTHAYEHALDFVLFENAPVFDFRQTGWPLLPADLQEAVLKKYSEWTRNFHTGRKRTQDTCVNISKAKKGKPGRKLSSKEKALISERMSGDDNPAKRPEIKEKISKAKKGKPLAINDKPKSKSHREKISKALKEFYSKRKAQNENHEPLV